MRDTPPRLGRGLAALLGEIGPSAAAATPGIRDLPLAALEPGPFQPRGRMEPGSLAELTESIRASGVLQPLLARPHPTAAERFQIVAGERRWRAAQAAGLHDIPALVRPLGDAEAMAAALVENLQRSDLNAIEEAEGYRRLLDECGMTHDRLAQTLGKSRSHISNTLRLLNLPPTVQGEVRSGGLSAGHARALLAHPDPARAALAVIAGNLSVRQTEAMAGGADARSERPGRPPRDADTEALARELTARLGLRVDIQSDGKAGTVRIRFRSLDQLDGLLLLLNGRTA
ncbi:MAG: ParB/RepB/Spo0J family partition protein [Acetobacteraceae bacterium]|nr:ParB/RepB/Spo0J family partition protein [Acetobacteraceae bacterium]